MPVGPDGPDDELEADDLVGDDPKESPNESTENTDDSTETTAA
ncbi:hypothetical protein [Halopelagius fulvigenes]|uniref:Uncharacterized protein n=1 Tax=Halopelagius fulvigenes TaxID=1198324 RepID=A0ABD5TX73_9EURY